MSCIIACKVRSLILAAMTDYSKWFSHLRWP